jgi:hypothetical protein
MHARLPSQNQRERGEGVDDKTGGVYWIHLVQNRDKRRALKNTTNLHPVNARDFLNRSTTVGF